MTLVWRRPLVGRSSSSQEPSWPSYVALAGCTAGYPLWTHSKTTQAWPKRPPITRVMEVGTEPELRANPELAESDKVVNLAVFKIKKSLRSEGFDLLTDDQGKLTLVLRRPPQ